MDCNARDYLEWTGGLFPAAHTILYLLYNQFELAGITMIRTPFNHEEAELYQYLYDLQGYLVFEDVLSKDEVATINQLLDEHLTNLPENRQGKTQGKAGKYNTYRFGMAGGSYASGPGFLDWGKPLVDLIEHPLIMEIMRMQLGDCFRLDRIFGMHMQKGMKAGKLHADYGALGTFCQGRTRKVLPSTRIPGAARIWCSCPQPDGQWPGNRWIVPDSRQPQQSFQIAGSGPRREIFQNCHLSQGASRQHGIFQ